MTSALMTRGRMTIGRMTLGGALFGFTLGATLAAWDLATTSFVREFQAGSGAEVLERLSAFVQRGAIEGIGFGLAALIVALIARALGPVAGSVGAAFTLGAAAFVTMATFGTWLGEEALPFLARGDVLLLDAFGLAGFLAAYGVFHVVVRRCLAPARAPLSVALASALCAAGGGALAFRALRTYRDGDLGLALAGALCVGAVITALGAAMVLSKFMDPAVRALAERTGPLVPRKLTRTLALALVVCVLASLPLLRFSALAGEAAYERISSRRAEAGPNVVLVTVDTLRADHLSCYGYERPTSPFLDSIAAEGARFADPAAPAAWTKPSTGTILTGLYPSRHGALYHGSSLQLPEGERTLAEAFREEGFVTAGFVTNPNVKRIFNFDRGFDEFFDSPVEDTVTLASIRGSLAGRAASALFRHQFNWKYENDVFQMNQHVLSWLRENHDQRFFLYLHYIDPHIPYSPPDEYREMFERELPALTFFNERKRRVGVDLYDAEIRYTDDGLAQLVDALEDLGIWDNTIFVVTSDHGEEFLEHGVLGHGFSLYQGVIQVPLIVHGPGVAAGVVVDEPVQLVDLAATVLDLATDKIDRLGDGHSFAAAARGEAWKSAGPIFYENEFGTGHSDLRSFVLNGVREGDWKLVLTQENMYFPPEEFGGEALYHLGDDPDESENRITDEASRVVVEGLLERLREHSRFLSETGFRDVAPAAISADIEANLKALGY